ncbi:AAA family ATPase [Desulfobacula sp.]|uniref:ATP-binding protein n=1 Tax=Desulfobacula sp. TaxID=2593537 RepID=UPI0025C6FA2B|nr:AAA family ATPase [Desulfobacula sp.]MBC2705891.1 ATP-binding protein [Desulfobacula sp.]
MIERTALKYLITWKESKNRKPLILRGARQVGKTTVVEIFSKQFQNRIFLNMEDAEHKRFFKESLSFKERISAIFLAHSTSVNDKNTLLFIDEIQASKEAVATLRYFYEFIPHVYVIAAGSLLETVINTKISFPVGRVEYLMIHPCSFKEFLYALKEYEIANLFSQIPFPDYAHDTTIKLFREYMLVGGMPEAVSVYAGNRDMVEVNNIYEGLISSFIEDVEKYASNGFIRVVRHILKTAFPFAGNRIKFQGFGNSLYSSKDVHESLNLLEKAMLMKLIYPTTAVSLPAIDNLKKSPKLQLLDSGMFHYQAGLQQELFIEENLESVAFGKSIEHTMGIMLYAEFMKPSSKLNFWVREKRQSSAEVDFVFPYKTFLIPVEVKSGAAGKLRSLHQFMDRTPHNMAVRFCGSPVSIEIVKTVGGKNYNLLNLPWYLAGVLNDYFKYLDQKRIDQQIV